MKTINDLDPEMLAEECEYLTADELDLLLRVETTIDEGYDILKRNRLARVALDILWEFPEDEVEREIHKSEIGEELDPSEWRFNGEDTITLDLGCPHCPPNLCRECPWTRAHEHQGNDSWRLSCCCDVEFGGVDARGCPCVELDACFLDIYAPDSQDSYDRSARFLEGHIEWAKIIIECEGIELPEEE